MRPFIIRCASGNGTIKGKQIGVKNGNIIGGNKDKGGNQTGKKMIEKKINPFKKIVDINKGGYNAYLKNKALLGKISYILND